MMVLLKRYGFLFIPPVYWFIYLGARLTYNGLAGEFTPEFFQSIRHDGVFIICGLLVFIFCCLRIEVGDGELSGVLFLCIISFHVIALVITLVFCLWRGAILWDVICAWQIGTSMLLLFFIPVLTFYYGN